LNLKTTVEYVLEIMVDTLATGVEEVEEEEVAAIAPELGSASVPDLSIRRTSSTTGSPDFGVIFFDLAMVPTMNLFLGNNGEEEVEVEESSCPSRPLFSRHSSSKVTRVSPLSPGLGSGLMELSGK